jgi:hypothetical protein
MCPLLAPAFQGLAFSFLFFLVVAAINSTNEANKAGGSAVKQSIFLDVYD